MTDLEPLNDASAVELARECLYRFLSLVAAGPYSPAFERVLAPTDMQLATEAAELLQQEVGPGESPLGFGERSPAGLAESMRRLCLELEQPLDKLRAQHDRVFGLLAPRECPPYETEYHANSEAFYRSQQMADIAGFYHAFGIDPAAERPDHLALELEFLALLLLKDRQARAAASDASSAADQAFTCELALESFFRDHFSWWVAAFAAGLLRKAESGYLAALARVLASFVAAERIGLDIEPLYQPVQPSFIERPDEQSGCSSCPLQT